MTPGSVSPRGARPPFLAAGLLLAAAAIVEASGAVAPAKTAPDLPESPLPFTRALVYESQGSITCSLGVRERDRTITIAPVREDGRVKSLDFVIVDHVEDGRTFGGRVAIAEDGSLENPRPDIVNAANILAVSRAVVDRLRRGEASVVTRGQTEVSGEVHEVSLTHEKVPGDGPGPFKVSTRARSADGRISLQTISVIGPDGLPTHAVTKGTIQAFATLEVDLRLRRIDRRNPSN